MSSESPTPYAVQCPKHGRVFLTEREYDGQMNRSSERWFCTQTEEDPVGICGEWSEWDDDNYESAYDRAAPGYYEENEVCPECNGSGFQPTLLEGDIEYTCEACEGFGELVR